MRIAVLVSGNGTNLQALIDVKQKEYSIELVISDTPHAYALERAKKSGIPTEVVTTQIKEREQKRVIISNHILDLARREAIEAIVLAGFLTILRGDIIRAYSGRIINVHPALLPKFGGVGMYGDNVHKAVLAAGECESGCTVHLVDTGCDTGTILLQKKVAVLPQDTVQTLAQRIHVQEHKAIVEGVILLSHNI